MNCTMEDKLLEEVERLKEEFNKTTEKIIKDIKRKDKIMIRSDKRQQYEYDELQLKIHEVEKLNK